MKGFINTLKKHNRIRVGYGTAFFLLLISYFLTLFANQKLLTQAGWVDHTNNVMTYLEVLISNVKDGETGLRGYVAIKDKSFLEPYYNSQQKSDSVYQFLEIETSDNTLQQLRLDTLKKLINVKYNILQKSIDLYDANNLMMNDSLKALAYKGKETMNSIRSLTNKMQKSEALFLTERKNEMARAFKALNVIIIVSLIIAFLLLFFGFITYRNENKARQIADSRVQQYQGQLMDNIKELRNANKELIQMKSQEKFASTGRIARTIAHEVRNPLTNINLALEQLKSDIPDINEENNILFDMISRNSSRINQLITDLLDSTKFAELDFYKTSINTLLDEAIELSKDRITLNNIKIEKKYSSDICEVAVDKEKIKIAFLNIIVNAIEAMEPGKGILTITTKGENNKCIIEIKDNGIGMDKEALSKLFEPYFTNKQKGNGLGLTNTQNIILNHKGTIHVESEQRMGTSFIITLDFIS